jgi:prepilin-type processing-associated H-X9-DG protein
MLLPALSKARGMAKRIACANQLKQIGIGSGMYTNDNDGYMPFRQSTSSDQTLLLPSAPPISTLPALRPDYISDLKTFFCPANYMTTNKDINTIWPSRFGYFQLGMNRIDYPAKVFQKVKVWNNGVWNKWVSPSEAAFISDIAVTPSYEGNLWFKHSSHDDGRPRGANVLWGDFHVKWEAKQNLQVKDGLSYVPKNILAWVP